MLYKIIVLNYSEDSTDENNTFYEFNREIRSMLFSVNDRSSSDRV
jgi:hypothetical protein